MNRLAFGLLLSLVVSLVYPAVARAGRDDDQDSQGVPYENIQTCVQSSAGFNPDYSLRPLRPGDFFNHQTTQSTGFNVLNPDGTQTSTFRSVGITHETTPFAPPPFNIPISVSEGSCTGPLELLPDGSRLFNFTCTGRITSEGPNKDATFVLTNGASFALVDTKGQIGFVTNPSPPRIEIETITRTNGFRFTFEKVCARAGTNQPLRVKE